jgi:hypothetical protein
MWCKKCGYPLDGLGEPRCPECRRSFDVDEKGTFRNQPLLGKCPVCSKPPVRASGNPFSANFEERSDVACRSCGVRLARHAVPKRFTVLFFAAAIAWIVLLMFAAETSSVKYVRENLPSSVWQCVKLVVIVFPAAFLISIIIKNRGQYSIQEFKVTDADGLLCCPTCHVEFGAVVLANDMYCGRCGYKIQLATDTEDQSGGLQSDAEAGRKRNEM